VRRTLRPAAAKTYTVEAGEERPVRIEIELNNSAGHLPGRRPAGDEDPWTPLEGRLEVVAHVDGETEKRLLTGFRQS
jgi:metal-dependent HD superfamily phosphatase/phosphodiesterase